MSVIVIEFITMDGIVSDPDGSAGTPTGGWAFRHGPEAVAGDKFRLGETLDQGVMLLGRRTWQLFSQIWPGRDDPFAARMNAAPKLVASRTLTDTSAWATSTLIDGDLIDTVKHRHRDIGMPPQPLFSAAPAHPIRWIGYDRPGYDRSPPNPGRRAASAASHVAAIANALAIAAPVLVLHWRAGPGRPMRPRSVARPTLPHCPTAVVRRRRTYLRPVLRPSSLWLAAHLAQVARRTHPHMLRTLTRLIDRGRSRPGSGLEEPWVLAEEAADGLGAAAGIAQGAPGEDGVADPVTHAVRSQ
ncbi:MULTISPECIES: dihydrofolate reductase family protein [Actinomadura]|uniref:dihydrofolate reductase family protein n=1 Tax=Actinomadura TaxID=1988 RepID=UPI0003AD40FB|nr:hypothetical protein [Actinomadura madurae]